MFTFNPAALPGDVANAALFLPATPLGGAWGAFNPAAPPGDIASLALFLGTSAAPPSMMFPGPPPDLATWCVIGAAFDDFGVPSDGVVVKATALNGNSISFDAVRFQRDGTVEATSGQALTYRNTQGEVVEHSDAPATPGVAWLLLPPNVSFRFDSVGAYNPQTRREMIEARKVTITKSGSLWQLLQDA